MGSGVVLWVFVVLVHPVTMSPPYATQAACEAARHRVELRNTTGCHLEPISSPSSPRRAGDGSLTSGPRPGAPRPEMSVTSRLEDPQE